jgi:hypothetical protein
MNPLAVPRKAKQAIGGISTKLFVTILDSWNSDNKAY